MTDSEKQMAAVARKRLTHKEIKVFVKNPLKDLMQMCHEDGLTQAEVLTALIKSEAQKRCM
ncbi:replication regulatory RepB family protein [Escherichia coli P0302308.10]|nr:replication regulatory RepB family protein [Escherichia coli P0302308.10]